MPLIELPEVQHSNCNIRGFLIRSPADQDVELLVEIGKIILPWSPLDLSKKPFIKWTEQIRYHGHLSTHHMRSYYALMRSCKLLHRVLINHPSLIYVKRPSPSLLRSVLQLASLPSLSIESFKQPLDRITQDDNQQGHVSPRIPQHRNPTDFSLLPENKSIDTLFLLRGDATVRTAQLLFQKLQGLKIFYLAYDDFEAGLADTHDFNFAAVIAVLLKNCQNLEKLVVTRVLQVFTGDNTGLGSNASLQGHSTLRSLSIGSILLLGGYIDDDHQVHKFLPPSLVELEVMYDDSKSYPFITGEETCRPVWLFSLLGNKKSATPNLQRIRIISSEEWSEGQEEIDPIWNKEYATHPDDWVPANGHEKWQPPMELILAFKRAKVSFGIWLHVLRRFRMVVPGGEWFKDDWEHEWAADVDDPDMYDGEYDRYMD